jgi:hypothetical protein
MATSKLSTSALCQRSAISGLVEEGGSYPTGCAANRDNCNSPSRWGKPSLGIRAVRRTAEYVLQKVGHGSECRKPVLEITFMAILLIYATRR